MPNTNYDDLVISRRNRVPQSNLRQGQQSGLHRPMTSSNMVAQPAMKKKKSQPWLWLIPVGTLVVGFLLGYFWLFKPPTYITIEDDIPVTDEGGLLALTGPADQACPLNGKLFTKAEREAWEQRRPLAVMVENTPDARPQSGLSKADIIYEAVAEGGITRFMPIFYCAAQAEDVVIAPVRSARTYYVNLASGYNYPLYAHVGGANEAGPTDALGQLNDYGWAGENDMNQFSLGYPTFVRNYNRLPGRTVATEHTMETTSEELWKAAAKRGWTNMSPALTVGKRTIPVSDWKDGFTGWKFVDGQAASSPTASKIDYEFWTGQPTYAVSWKYDAATNTYLRSHGGEAHIDLNNDQQIAVSNVIVMKTKEEGPINDKQHMMYHVIGTGDALIFKNGEVIEAKWSKKDREAELNFTDAKGNPIEFVRGQIWVSVVDKDNKPTYN